MWGECDTALRLANRARPRVARGDLSTHARIAHAVGMAHYLGGDVREAEAAFLEAAQLAQQASNRNLSLDVVSCLAMTLIAAGRLRDATGVCEDALAADPANPQAPPAGALYLALARVQYERNQLVQAEATLDRSVDLARQANWPHVLWQAYALLNAVRAGREDFAGAHAAQKAAERIAEQYPAPHVHRRLAACRARLALEERELQAAVRWAEVFAAERPADGLLDFEDLTLARLRMAEGQVGEALTLLESVTGASRSAGRAATLIEALVLRAQALAGLNRGQEGQEALSEAVDLAAPEGFATVFMSTGSGFVADLARAGQGSVPADTRRLAGAPQTNRKAAPQIPAAGMSTSLRPSGLTPDGEWREPLSPRELEVLRLLAEGLSNAEIAARLFLSVNTLRAHTSNIYQKLDVHSRIQAVHRARGLGLLTDA
jgi:LuxR family maltose regulon positive regulatory protein